MTFATLSGSSPAMLANDVSDAIHAALTRGMGIDEASSIVAAVVADYARGEYGDAYLDALSQVVKSRAGEPMPRAWR